MNRILLIDDDASVRKAVSRLLTQHGFTVETASDGVEGLEKFSSGTYDAVILDVWMPRKGGLETLSEIRAAAPQAKVIVISGNQGPALTRALETARERGAIATLEKPFTSEQLLGALTLALGASS